MVIKFSVEFAQKDEDYILTLNSYACYNNCKLCKNEFLSLIRYILQNKSNVSYSITFYSITNLMIFSSNDSSSFSYSI